MAHLDIIQTLPRAFRCICLELAREPTDPGCDWRVGYMLIAPLDADGRLDAAIASDFYGACRVLRLGSGADPEEGYLRREAHGAWIFERECGEGGETDAPGFRLAEHRFVVGASVTLKEGDGETTYRVASVEPL